MIYLSMKKTNCCIEKCEREAIARGLCVKHYLRFRKNGTLLEYKVMDRKCDVEGCENKYLANGFCSKHLDKYRKYGDPLFSKIERHGMRNTPEYSVWRSMKRRCNCEADKSYKYYGGRGITVCKEWAESFTAFYKDMGKRPFEKAQLDRADNNGNYEPSNCRWVTRTENMRNTNKYRERNNICQI